MREIVMPSSPKMHRPAHYAAPDVQKRERWKRHDERRGSSNDRGYGAKWQKARLAYMAAHPLCVCCEANGRVTPTAMVDHAIPHELDWSIFWNSDDWQSLCDDCNQRIKQPLELAYKRGELKDTSLLKLARPMPELFF